MATFQTSTPCENLFCHFDEARGVCLGCFRTKYDLKHWTQYDDIMRQKIMHRSFERMDAFFILNQQFFNRDIFRYDA
jgi:predicted Fe-S protein YdhL (DUF1289 family)